MQYLKNLLAFEAGTVLLSTGDLRVLNINLSNKVIDVNVEDKEFLKRAIALREQFTSRLPTAQNNEQKKSFSPLATLKTVAETLKDQGITLTVCYRGQLIATLGANAKPTFLQTITKTRAIALNSLYQAIKLGVPLSKVYLQTGPKKGEPQKPKTSEVEEVDTVEVIAELKIKSLN